MLLCFFWSCYFRCDSVFLHPATVLFFTFKLCAGRSRSTIRTRMDLTVLCLLIYPCICIKLIFTLSKIFSLYPACQEAVDMTTWSNIFLGKCFNVLFTIFYLRFATQQLSESTVRSLTPSNFFAVY